MYEEFIISRMIIALVLLTIIMLWQFPNDASNIFTVGIIKNDRTVTITVVNIPIINADGTAYHHR
jgi:hypothetical protein